jgi:hypothetical protein
VRLLEVRIEPGTLELGTQATQVRRDGRGRKITDPVAPGAAQFRHQPRPGSRWRVSGQSHWPLRLA